MWFYSEHSLNHTIIYRTYENDLRSQYSYNLFNCVHEDIQDHAIAEGITGFMFHNSCYLFVIEYWGLWFCSEILLPHSISTNLNSKKIYKIKFIFLSVVWQVVKVIINKYNFL